MHEDRAALARRTSDLKRNSEATRGLATQVLKEAEDELEGPRARRCDG